MSNDDLDHIPSIVPTRDSVPPRAAARARPGNGKGTSRTAPPGSGGAGGSGLVGRLLATLALVVAAVACAWAWQLQQQVQRADERAASYAQRIGDLEARLSDTDEGMNQNAEVQAAKIRELDSEVRKLWDNVWKKTRERLAQLEADSARQGKSIEAAAAALSTAQSQLKSVSADTARLKGVAGDLERLMASAKTNQAEVERVADTLNRINLDLARLDKRVAGNEEWVASINAFRKQVNANLTDLAARIRAQQAAP